MRLSRLDGFIDCIVNEHVLLLRLNQMVSLSANVFQIGEHIHVAAARNLPHHCVQSDEAAGAANASAETKKRKYLFFVRYAKGIYVFFSLLCV